MPRTIKVPLEIVSMYLFVEIDFEILSVSIVVSVAMMKNSKYE
jgi:hypothetical protein